MFDVRASSFSWFAEFCQQHFVPCLLYKRVHHMANILRTCVTAADVIMHKRKDDGVIALRPPSYAKLLRLPRQSPNRLSPAFATMHVACFSMSEPIRADVWRHSPGVRVSENTGVMAAVMRRQALLDIRVLIL